MLLGLLKDLVGVIHVRIYWASDPPPDMAYRGLCREKLAIQGAYYPYESYMTYGLLQEDYLYLLRLCDQQ